MANPEQRPIGDVSVPLNTGDVREFKKEMGRLLEDPIGVSERLDQFLRQNIYTWVELQSILGILFTMEEREMIRHSGMRVWDRGCQGPDQGDQEWPMQDPGWNNQNERHRQNMSDLWWMIIRGIREAVPKGQNIRKALSEHQAKDERLADWLERLRKDLQLYSGVDPDTAAGQVLLKTQFVAKAWRHIGKKLEKEENWQDRGLQELLREAQKVLIHPVIQGMQMTAMPIDPELAAKGKPNSLMILKARPTHTQKKGPKEMLTEHKETTLAQEMLTKFEKECEKLDAAWEMLEKLEAEMREHENLDYWEYRRNRDSVLIKKHESI
ncbi:hypothetical protein DUI87_06397 [Hirundo rustica rustica]|uniref:Core shell protein Gag P30 domain-containing protein n=1 Tax=Hirundo rustica rustica TaxID=333673 RepID=A0A3M0KUE9_HIRRU|nr:hypothetical protein DUI87_06397 [Hirundo rustica rustica]